jgi:hypothetical protein
MPEFANKVLWAVDMDNQGDEDRIFYHASLMGAGGVAIRTTSPRLPDSIQRFHQRNLKVYGWRWPAVVKNSGGRYSELEAKYVVQTLIPKGLDGYIVDPESEEDNGYNDWQRTDIPVSVADLAKSFCDTIRAAAGTNFALGVTSGGDYPATRPHIPWAQFVEGCDALFPQI